MLCYDSFGILHCVHNAVRVMVLYQEVHFISAGTGHQCLITGEVNFAHRIKVASTGFFIVKLVFLFENDILGESPC